jgi:dTMP kinase
MKHAGPSQSSKRVMLSSGQYSGLLIAFEGADGSGKTTQRKLFKSWLRHRQEDVVVTKWNSSPMFQPIIKQRKLARSLDPVTYAVLHAADFWQRYNSVIQPALFDGKVVLADRYVFTGLARDAARGIQKSSWVRDLYNAARQPDLTFYFDAPIATCAERISVSRQIKFYEAGQDVTGIVDSLTSYLTFTERVVAEYKRLHEEFGFVIVDAQLPIYDQHQFIRETYISRFGSTTGREPLFAPQLSAFLSEVDV